MTSLLLALAPPVEIIWRYPSPAPWGPPVLMTEGKKLPLGPMAQPRGSVVEKVSVCPNVTDASRRTTRIMTATIAATQHTHFLIQPSQLARSHRSHVQPQFRTAMAKQYYAIFTIRDSTVFACQWFAEITVPHSGQVPESFPKREYP